MIQNILSTKTISVFLPMKNVNFFIVKVLVKSNKGGCEVTLIYFYTYYMYPFFHF